MLCLLAGSLRVSSAADIDFPTVGPQFTIDVKAATVGKAVRGAYDVLAFEGDCRLKQGEFQASADEIVLWIERSGPQGVEHPGKIICYLNGRAEASWSGGRQVRDHRWMGRLFSLHPVRYHAQEVQRYDIPNLDWNREPGSQIQLAQFAQPQSSLGGGPTGSGAPLAAPPLLGPSSSGGFGALPAQQAPMSRPSNQVTPLPGAVPWTPSGSTDNSDLLPSGGVVIPGDGSAPVSSGRLPEPVPSAPVAPTFPPPQTQITRQVPTPNPFAAKSVELFSRSRANPPNISFVPREGSGESVAQITGGFRLVVQGIRVTQADGSVVDYGTVTLEADNAVVWVQGETPMNFFRGLSSTPDRPIELYLDGNIVFQQGNRVIYADRMYYNVSSEYGMVLSAEILTPVPQYQGLLRLKADVLEQRDQQNFVAYGAAVTSSRLGVPRYWLQADEVQLRDTRNESDLSVFAPADPSRETNMRATANNNVIYLGGVPIFYWPTFSTNLSKPSYYFSSLRVKNDDIFGTQVFGELNVYQILGIEGPRGTDLRLSTDYLSERGPAVGFHFEYNRPTWLFGAPGTGFTDAWFLQDDGLDTVGSDRINLTPEEDTRGRILSRHRLFLSPNLELMAESGWISDRNFLEQFFETEWDQQKDFSTALRLRRYNGNRMFDISGQARVNDFFTESEWLPRIDHYWLAQDLLGQRLTWNAHTSVGYAHQRVASTPLDPADAAKFALLPWETDSEGLRATTRQELSMPVSLGAWKLVPFVSGEAGFWNEDINQDDLTRLTGQAGIRTSLPFWKVYPNVENRLFDLRGIAHKITLESEFFYADSNQDFDQLPLYDPLDDNAQEHFRRRFIFNSFGGVLPPEFDERSFALRSGLQRWVTAASSEVVDDMTQMRFGINQRWQTKRGLPGQERIVDLVELDVDWIVFPRAQRDNFGEDVGAINYDFRYHVGDRLTLLSDGYFDVFSQGLKSISAGAQISRPGRADAYLGFLSLEGPISANVLNGSMTYRMNEKWIFNTSAAFDFASTGSIGQSLGLTRIGETALIRIGANVDHTRDNVSFNFSIEPRFLPTVQLGSVGGELIPPAGLFGLE